MAVPSLRHRIGRREIENKEKEQNKRVKEVKKEPLSKEEHDKRVNLLKGLGLLKK